MTNNLKKSLFVGLAALSFVSVASATNASAKSYAKVTSNNALTTDPTTRNFESTGSNALMTKAGTLKGAKTVASKATMKSLMNSKSSKNYFRAYREATTNRGSKYYKVVSMDQKYRGWIYVGGVKSAKTTTEATLADSVKNTKFYIKDASKNTLWTAPQYTQYKASKVAVGNVDTTQGFFADGAVTKTREGSLYYHVKAASNNSVSGWIYAGKGQAADSSKNVSEDFGGLTTTPISANANENNSVNVQFKDANGNVISDLGTYTYVNKAGNTKKDDQLSSGSGSTALNDLNTQVAKYAKDKGYEVDSLTSAQYGHTYRVTASKAAMSKVSFAVNNYSATSSAPAISSSDLQNGYPKLTSDQQKTALFGKTNQNFDSSALNGLLSNAGDLTGVTKYNTSDSSITVKGTKGDQITVPAHSSYYLTYSFNTVSANSNAKYGDNVTALYDTTAHLGDAPKQSNTNNDSNSNYAN